MFDRPAEGRQKKVFFYRPHVYDIAGVPRRNVFVERCVSPFVAKKQLRHVRDQLGVPRGWMSVVTFWFAKCGARNTQCFVGRFVDKTNPVLDPLLQLFV